MTSVLVIDARSRALNCFTASVTLAQADNPNQIVLRHGLGMGILNNLLAQSRKEEYVGGGRNVIRNVFVSPSPILVMGEYSARSSAGHAAIFTGDRFVPEHRGVLVVGGLGPAFGKKGLKVLANPIHGELVTGPVEVEWIESNSNSNVASTGAALDGVHLLSAIEPSAVFLSEGQSDAVFIVRFRTVPSKGATVVAPEFPVEHRAEMFSRGNIVRRILFSAAYRDLAYGREEDNRPSDEEVAKSVISQLEGFFGDHRGATPKSLDCLGRGSKALSRLNFQSEVPSDLEKLLTDLKNPPAPEPAAPVVLEVRAHDDSGDEFVEITE